MVDYILKALMVAPDKESFKKLPRFSFQPGTVFSEESPIDSDNYRFESDGCKIHLQLCKMNVDEISEELVYAKGSAFGLMPLEVLEGEYREKSRKCVEFLQLMEFEGKEIDYAFVSVEEMNDLTEAEKEILNVRAEPEPFFVTGGESYRERMKSAIEFLAVKYVENINS